MSFDSDYVISLMKKCGEIMLSADSVESENGAINAKDGTANFVTLYDKRVQEMLISGLTEKYPEAVFLAEEKENIDDFLNAPMTFVIDPIDGTTNFIHDYRCSAVSVGVFTYGKPLFGAIYMPYSNEMFSADVGKGAFLNGRRIGVSDRPLSKALVSFGTAPYYRDKHADSVFESAKRVFLSCADIRRSGSAAYDICCVACGRTEAFFEEILSPWDFAAGSILISESGGICSDYNGEDVSCFASSSFVCSNSLIHKQITEMLKE